MSKDLSSSEQNDILVQKKIKRNEYHLKKKQSIVESMQQTSQGIKSKE